MPLPLLVQTIASGLLVGTAATFTMDRLARVSRRLGLTAGIDPRWMGRWFHGVLRGRVAWEPAQEHEQRLALMGHYAIGIGLAIAYLLGAAHLDTKPEGLAPALTYGFATNVFPWLLMFPAMGFGLFGSKGPAECKLFRSSLVNHLFFGLGLWGAVQFLHLA